ncbi:hypothetical protein GJ744_000005 [Endocarpon pusillum]|uniref:Uncharacterized protein n=1 Tax=Endocarpon pusillum TaxID=364733 RepID=A0A8H7B001_9EURO|nr:hypothetical protein GJ744_000005 [Endocarpon pusillum]
MDFRRELFMMLQEWFAILQHTLDPRIDQQTLREWGIDTSLVDLNQETECGGVYFCPLPESRWKMVVRTPEPKFPFWPRSASSIADSYMIYHGLSSQRYGFREADGAKPPTLLDGRPQIGLILKRA